MNKKNQQAIDKFHKLYYSTTNTTFPFWRAQPSLKYPNDLLIYQEIIYETRPNLIIELGTMWGGTTLFLSDMCTLFGQGAIITVDIDKRVKKYFKSYGPNVKQLIGDDCSPKIVKEIQKTVDIAERTMIILDSNHKKDHVLKQLKLYSPMVTSGCYMIVEDTNINGHPVYTNYGPGPKEAVDEFLKTHPEFTVDQTREKFLVTANPGGYLLKK